VGEKRDACTALWVILKERCETVPSFISAKVLMPRHLPCDVTCVLSIMVHYGNMETPDGRENKSNVNNMAGNTSRAEQ